MYSLLYSWFCLFIAFSTSSAWAQLVVQYPFEAKPKPHAEAFLLKQMGQTPQDPAALFVPALFENNQNGLIQLHSDGDGLHQWLLITQKDRVVHTSQLPRFPRHLSEEVAVFDLNQDGRKDLRLSFGTELEGLKGRKRWVLYLIQDEKGGFVAHLFLNSYADDDFGLEHDLNEDGRYEAIVGHYAPAKAEQNAYWVFNVFGLGTLPLENMGTAFGYPLLVPQKNILNYVPDEQIKDKTAFITPQPEAYIWRDGRQDHFQGRMLLEADYQHGRMQAEQNRPKSGRVVLDRSIIFWLIGGIFAFIGLSLLFIWWRGKRRATRFLSH